MKLGESKFYFILINICVLMWKISKMARINLFSLPGDILSFNELIR